MCRLATYIGPSISIENIVTAPTHSLLSQSLHANESKVDTNGDGFGLAWYGHLSEPGLYRECLPAWSDENLINLCRMMKSPFRDPVRRILRAKHRRQRGTTNASTSCLKKLAAG